MPVQSLSHSQVFFWMVLSQSSDDEEVDDGWLLMSSQSVSSATLTSVLGASSFLLSQFNLSLRSSGRPHYQHGSPQSRLSHVKPLYHYCIKAALPLLCQSRFTAIESKPLYNYWLSSEQVISCQATISRLHQSRFTAIASKALYRYCIKVLLPLLHQSPFTANVSKPLYRYCVKALLPLLPQSPFTTITLTALKHRICLLSYLRLLETVVT